MTDAAVTMDLYPQPAPGQPKPWAFPAPDRGVLGNGLTVLRCHRPRQQLVAVEIGLDVPLDAEPSGLDGVASIMVNALSQGAGEYTAEEFSAELERCGATLDARADYAGARLSLEVPLSRLPRALGLLAEALRVPTFADSEVERLVRNRLDGIPIELADPGQRAARQLAQELFPASARMSRPRKGTEDTVARIDAAAVRAFYTAHVRPATATAVVVGDLAGIDLDEMLAGSLGGWTSDRAEPLPMPPAPADNTGRVVIVDRPGAVQTQVLIGRTGPDRHDPVLAGPGARHVLPGGHAHVPAGPGAARGEGLHLRDPGVSAGAAIAGAARPGRRHGGGGPRHQRFGGHGVHRPGPG